MAEVVLGVASAGIGVAAFALQLAESITKLKSFCEKVKDAPMELQEYVDEIGYGSKHLHKISEEMSKRGVADLDYSLLAESLNFAHRALDRITAVIDQFEVAMNSKRYRASVKFALHEKKMDRLLQKLASAKTDLQNAFNIYDRAQLKQEMMSQFVALEAGQKHLSQQFSALANTPELLDAHREGQKRRQDAQVCEQGSTTGLGGDLAQYQLRLPPWLCSRVWNLCVSRATSGWDFSLRTYKIISYTHPSLSMVISNDVEGLKRLLDAKALSIYDRFEDGATLWTRAVSYGRIDVARFLFENGAKVLFPSEPQDSELQYLFVSEDCLDYIHDSLAYLCSCGYDDVYGTASYFSDSWASKSVKDRLEYVPLSGLYSIPTSSRFLFHLLANIRSDKEGFVARAATGLTPLHLIARLCLISCRRDSNRKDSQNTCLLLIEDCVRAGADLHAEYTLLAGYGLGDPLDITQTPLIDLLEFTNKWGSYDSNIDSKRANNALRLWVSGLKTAGVDLEQYGEAEISRFRSLMQRWEGFVPFSGLLYGPDVNDWRLWYEHAGDEYAGLFWDLIDHPERAMPGAWDDWQDRWSSYDETRVTRDVLLKRSNKSWRRNRKRKLIEARKWRVKVGIEDWGALLRQANENFPVDEM